MKILSLDIETSPHLAHVWGLWDQNVGLPMLREVSEVLCFAAKFQGERKVYFADSRDKAEMIGLAHHLLDETDVVMSWNGKRFDLPHLNREFILAGMTPPSPYEQIDLLLTARRQFKFASNKLDHVAKQLGLAGKVKHSGFDLWLRVMAGDETAWRQMRRYNIQDVLLLEDLYERLQPWIPNHPSRTLYDGTGACPVCSSNHVQKRGVRRTKVSSYQSYQCQACGSWLRGGRKLDGIDIRQGAVA